MIENILQGENLGARIKVIGVGGGGTNAVNRMIEAGVGGIEYYVANTDTQSLRSSCAPVRVQLGSRTTRGLGAGSNPALGRTAALESTETLIECLEGADMVFITAGLGGGTGTGAAPVIASLAAELGALTVGVVTRPFPFEGKRRMSQADMGWHELNAAADTVITIPNEKLLETVDRSLPLTRAFCEADDVLRQAIQGISDLVNVPGLINLDFADVKSVMQGMGKALMASGESEGESRTMNATLKAINSPLLDDVSLAGARGVLINICGGEDLTLHEVNEASSLVCTSSDEDANIIFGAVIDPNMHGRVRVTIIATGFGQARFVEPADNVMQNVSETALSTADSLTSIKDGGKLDITDTNIPAYLRASVPLDLKGH